MQTAEEVIHYLGLKPLPGEGGYFAETYRSQKFLDADPAGKGYPGQRSLCTAIYYLLTPTDFSAMHKLPGDELFHFYFGDAVEMLQLFPNGQGTTFLLGTNFSESMRPQVLVPGNVWQGSRLRSGGRFALLGTTMAPGFDFADYMPGLRKSLITQYPVFEKLITELTCG